MTSIWSFVLVVGLLTLTPGLDTALILRTATLRGRREAWGVVGGIQAGTMVWGVLTSAGITALFTASHVAYEVLRWAGAAYLVWMGLRMLFGGPAMPPEPAVGAGWRRGLLTNLLNPKMGAFYVALLPQFIPAGASPLLYGMLLAGVHVLLGIAWSAVLVTAAHGMRGLLRRPAAKRWMDRISGLAIMGFGVRLALSER